MKPGRSAITKEGLYEMALRRHFQDRICRDKREFLSRQKILHLWRVSTSEVLRIAKQISDEFTTADIASAMGEPEYNIRVALSWLVRRGLVERCGERELFTKSGEQRYFVNTYRVKQGVAEVDFDTLMRAFYR